MAPMSAKHEKVAESVDVIPVSMHEAVATTDSSTPLSISTGPQYAPLLYPGAMRPQAFVICKLDVARAMPCLLLQQATVSCMSSFSYVCLEGFSCLGIGHGPAVAELLVRSCCRCLA